jgi:hypothetical protein
LLAKEVRRSEVRRTRYVEIALVVFEQRPTSSTNVTPVGNGLDIRPLVPAPGSRVDFGAEVAPCDLARLSDADFTALERAVLTHHVVVVRGQAGLSPRDQFELTKRFDPTVQAYGHGHNRRPA